MAPAPTPSRKGKVLVVDDEPHQRLIMEKAVRSLLYDVDVAESGMKALEKIRFGHYDVLITDMQMPEMDGIKLVESARRYDSSVSAIVVTAHGTIETAVDAIKKGAEDFLQKPVEFKELELVLARVFKQRTLARENRKLQTENEVLKRNLGIRYHLSNTIGVSEKAKRLVEAIRRHTKARTPVLILGEPGVGKDDVCRMIHYNSPWAENALIVFDGPSVPVELQKAHLFGEEEGVESGVKTASRPGLVEKAHLGSLVVNGLHKVEPECQGALARVLADNQVQRTGGKKFYPAVVRLMATSSKAEWDKAVKDGAVREEMRHILEQDVLEVPPLRERREDIPLLFAANVKRVAEAFGKPVPKIERPVVEALLRYDFPGNFKELEIYVETALARLEGDLLKLEHFPALPRG